MKVSLIQMNIELGDVKANQMHAEDLIRKAALEKPDVIILPEMWNTSYMLKDIHNLADNNGQPSAGLIQNLSKELGINIIAGSIADKRQGKVYNTSYVFAKSGERLAQYSKTHLFGLMQEDQYLERGNSRCYFHINDVPVGMIICYELRFPEITRSLALDGAKILFVPAQWPNPRMHPWKILVQARAIENQMFVVAVNRVGKEGNAEFFGSSMVVDPLGNIIMEGSDKEEILTIDIDLTEVDKVRSKMTCFNDRVEEVYERQWKSRK